MRAIESKRPVKVVNDAAMQDLGNDKRGKMVVQLI